MLPEQLKLFANFIEAELGIIYSEVNMFQLQNRLELVAKELGLPDTNAVFEQARGGITGRLKEVLTDVATNNESSFFRDPKVYDALRKSIFPELLAKSKTQSLQIWSTAASFGQEPYSLGMLVRDIGFSCRILATDISRRALERAKAGIYSELEVGRGLPLEMRKRYFDQLDDRWVVKDILKSLIEFRLQNLLTLTPNSDIYDLILCRNVLIYQNVPNKARIVKSLIKQMRPGSLLILGAGESMIGISEEFEQVSYDGVFLYRFKG